MLRHGCHDKHQPLLPAPDSSDPFVNQRALIHLLCRFELHVRWFQIFIQTKPYKTITFLKTCKNVLCTFSSPSCPPQSPRKSRDSYPWRPRNYAKNVNKSPVLTKIALTFPPPGILKDPSIYVRLVCCPKFQRSYSSN